MPSRKRHVDQRTADLAGGEILGDPTRDEILVRGGNVPVITPLTIERTWAGGCTDVVRYFIYVSEPTSVDEDNGGAPSVSVTPNPAADQVRVAWNAIGDPTTISLVDVQGRTVWMSGAHAMSADHAVVIPLDRIAAGTYTVCVATTSGMHAVRVVVQR